MSETENVKATTTKRNSRKTTQKKTETVPYDIETFEDELNLDKKVTVKNLAGWEVSFYRKHDGTGAINITKGGLQRLSRNEIQAQINDGNLLFIGAGNGSHATLYIEDADTRRWVGFEDENNPQMVFTEELVKKLFDMNQSDFETNLPIYIRTRAEKFALIETIRKLGLNDYRKIVFAENYTGFRV